MTWPSIGTGGGGSSPIAQNSTICEPSGSTVRRSTGSSPTSCLRSGSALATRAKERFPTKSGFFFDTAHAMPRSCGVTVPSVSCPMIG